MERTRDCSKTQGKFIFLEMIAAGDHRFSEPKNDVNLPKSD